jgi:hypothetical protein
MLSAFPVLDASNNSLSILLKPDLCVGTLALRVLDLSTNHITDPLPSTMPPYATMLRELSLSPPTPSHYYRQGHLQRFQTDISCGL